MTNSLLVWDRKGGSPDAGCEILYWQSFAALNGASVPGYVEAHAERLRAKYLSFIHDLGQSRVRGRRIVEHLALEDDFSFWWMTQLAEKSPFKSPGIYSCLRLLALEEILLERKPVGLRLISPDGDLAQAVRVLCANMGIPFEWRKAKPDEGQPTLRGLARKLPSPLKGAIVFARRLFEWWSLRQFQKPAWFSGDGAVFLCSYFAHLDSAACARGIFYSRQWTILPELLKDGGRRANWIHHFLPGPAADDERSGLRCLSRFNADANAQGAHAFLDCYLSWGVAARALKNWLRLNVVAWRLGDVRKAFSPRDSAAWLWPLLRDDWRTSLTGPVAVVNSFWVELFDSALKDIPPQKMGFYLCENQGWERAMLRSWRKNGHGEIVGYVHTTAPFWHLYYFDDPRTQTWIHGLAMPRPDRLAVNGRPTRKLLAESGIPDEGLVDVEALRYLSLFRTEPKRTADPNRARVLILGDIAPLSMRALLSNLSFSISRLPPGWRFTFKPHPLYVVGLADQPGLEGVGTTAEALDRILGEYDVVLAANSTSAAVDAYQVGLSVVIGLDGTDFNLSPLRGQPGARFAATAEEMLEALREAGQDSATKSGREEFFFLAPELPRWRRLLEKK